jgi:hypothetical protein
MLPDMNARSTQPFGRRGLPANFAAPQPAGTVPQRERRSSTVPPELVAVLMQRDGQTVADRSRGAERVPRSFRAAILAGCIVAIFNAATNATFAAEANDSLGVLSSFAGNSSVIVALLIGALWSGAENSAMTLLVSHRVLAAMERTSYFSYAAAGGIVALGFGLIMQILGKPPGAGGLGMAVLSGVGAGLFYRLFAGAQRRDL